MWQGIRNRDLFSRWVARLIIGIFISVFFWLNSQKYLAFQLQAPDVDQFSQAIWNTLHGRFLFTTITNQSILAFHFSPYMALLSPLLLIWPDIRILFLAQTVGIAATGLILFRIVEVKHRFLACWFLLAFCLNPSLHSVTLFELRRVTFAMPFLALILFGLHTNKKGVMLIGAIFALLVKEDLGLIVAMAGVFLLIFKRDWKWGTAITVLGIAWTAGMILWVIPGLRGGAYNQLGYFAEWGSSPAEIVSTIISNPLRVLERIFDQDGLLALWRLFLPVAFVLPFLAPEYVMMTVPLITMMLISSEPEMHELRRWYLAPVIPVLFGAIAVGLDRLSYRRAKWTVGALLIAALVSFILYSGAPLGGNFEPDRYVIGDRQLRAWGVIERVPEDAVVASQVAFIAPLSQREHIYLFPWYSIGEANIEYFVVGREFNSYPIPSHEIDWAIKNLIANPDVVVEQEVDGIYLLHQGGELLPAIDVSQVAEEAIKLDRIEVAVADKLGFFQTIRKTPVSVRAGQVMRVTLYWEALAAPNAERTVSVRLLDATGALVAQHDMVPVDGSRPTSWWQPGWRLRDVYYLSIPSHAVHGYGSLDLTLYDSYTREPVPFEEGKQILRLSGVYIRDQGAGTNIQ